MRAEGEGWLDGPECTEGPEVPEGLKGPEVPEIECPLTSTPLQGSDVSA